MNYNLIDNETKKRYEFLGESEVPYIEYIKAQDRIFLTHTEVPQSLEGKGVGSAIVEIALKEVEAKELTLVPLCPFVAGYIKRHPEWKKIVLKNIKID